MNWQVLLFIYLCGFVGVVVHSGDSLHTRISLHKSRMIAVGDEIQSGREAYELQQEKVRIRTAGDRLRVKHWENLHAPSPSPPSTTPHTHTPATTHRDPSEKMTSTPTPPHPKEGGKGNRTVLLKKVLNTVVNSSMHEMVNKLTLSLQNFLSNLHQSPENVSRLKHLLLHNTPKELQEVSKFASHPSLLKTLQERKNVSPTTPLTSPPTRLGLPRENTTTNTRKLLRKGNLALSPSLLPHVQDTTRNRLFPSKSPPPPSIAKELHLPHPQVSKQHFPPPIPKNSPATPATEPMGIWDIIFQSLLEKQATVVPDSAVSTTIPTSTPVAPSSWSKSWAPTASTTIQTTVTHFSTIQPYAETAKDKGLLQPIPPTANLGEGLEFLRVTELDSFGEKSEPHNNENARLLTFSVQPNHTLETVSVRTSIVGNTGRTAFLTTNTTTVRPFVRNNMPTIPTSTRNTISAEKGIIILNKDKNTSNEMDGIPIAETEYTTSPRGAETTGQPPTIIYAKPVKFIPRFSSPIPTAELWTSGKPTTDQPELVTRNDNATFFLPTSRQPLGNLVKTPLDETDAKQELQVHPPPTESLYNETEANTSATPVHVYATFHPSKQPPKSNGHNESEPTVITSDAVIGTRSGEAENRVPIIEAFREATDLESTFVMSGPTKHPSGEGVQYLVTGAPFPKKEAESLPSGSQLKPGEGNPESGPRNLLFQTILIGSIAGFCIIFFAIFGFILACQSRESSASASTKSTPMCPPPLPFPPPPPKGLLRVPNPRYFGQTNEGLSVSPSLRRSSFYYDTSASDMSLMGLDRQVESFLVPPPTFPASPSTTAHTSPHNTSPSDTSLLY